MAGTTTERHRVSTTAMVAPRSPPVREPITKAATTKRTYTVAIVSTVSFVNFIVLPTNKLEEDLSNYESFGQSQDLTKIAHCLVSVFHWLEQTHLLRAV